MANVFIFTVDELYETVGKAWESKKFVPDIRYRDDSVGDLKKGRLSDASHVEEGQKV